MGSDMSGRATEQQQDQQQRPLGGGRDHSIKSVASVTVESTLRTEKSLVIYWAQIMHVASAAGSWRHHQGGKGSPGCPKLFSVDLSL